jgi:hypothetical protein
LKWTVIYAYTYMEHRLQFIAAVLIINVYQSKHQEPGKYKIGLVKNALTVISGVFVESFTSSGFDTWCVINLLTLILTTDCY